MKSSSRDAALEDGAAASLTPLGIFKCLAEDTRLTIMQLLSETGELCVCELIWLLERREQDMPAHETPHAGGERPGISQPKVSRHLAQLRDCGLLSSERRGQWVYYRLSPAMQGWRHAILMAACEAQQEEVARWRQWLAAMPNRPERCAS
ncbi:ArsR family transcriptional regulator [Cobetia sp. 5-25-4-2]|uniref:ArsR family transcriptional regulator n=1 Tax=Cobetia sp. 5-25-4-2 TaxID=2737459 RepID=UPI001596F518|nr:ArsR family transcriptional regulator [Cobetia sp. 5-25-4-2]